MWLEFVPKEYVHSLRITPTMTDASVVVTSTTLGTGVSITVKDGSSVVGTYTGKTGQPVTVSPPAPKLWEPLNPFLYTMQVTLDSGDSVGSYFGLREVSLVSVAP